MLFSWYKLGSLSWEENLIFQMKMMIPLTRSIRLNQLLFAKASWFL
ncbi:hypothetical protein CsSME_00024110 [Camellia sinensis var. sinensis]